MPPKLRFLAPTLLIFLAFAATARPLVAAESAPAHAERIARGSARVRRNWDALRDEAKRITDGRLRASFLEITAQPAFTVVEGRRAAAPEIAGKLRESGLLPTDFRGALFPTPKPMPFIAAPGGPGGGHHSFPGGLVYHTLTNLKLGLAYAQTYRQVYGIRLDEDLLRRAAIWHDSAKTLTLPWQDDGSLAADEPMIAGVGAHHIWGIAEALYRGYATQFVVTVACAHNPPAPGSDLEKVTGFLRAAALIAGKPFAAAGLTEDGHALAQAAPLEAFVTHLDDHDYVLAIPSVIAVRESLRKTSPGATPWAVDEMLARDGDIPMFEADPRGQRFRTPVARRQRYRPGQVTMTPVISHRDRSPQRADNSRAFTMRREPLGNAAGPRGT